MTASSPWLATAWRLIQVWRQAISPPWHRLGTSLCRVWSFQCPFKPPDLRLALDEQPDDLRAIQSTALRVRRQPFARVGTQIRCDLVAHRAGHGVETTLPYAGPGAMQPLFGPRGTISRQGRVKRSRSAYGASTDFESGGACFEPRAPAVQQKIFCDQTSARPEGATIRVG